MCCGPVGEGMLPGEAEQDISSQRLGRVLTLSGSLGRAQHHSPGEVLAEKSKVEHWPYFPVSRGCASAGGPRAAGEVSVKPSILHPVSSSLKHPAVCSSGVVGAGGGAGTHWPEGSCG